MDNNKFNADEKECPYCAEIVKIKAIRCKHCHSDITEDIDEIFDLDFHESTNTTNNKEERCPKCYALLNSDASKCECGLKLNRSSKYPHKSNTETPKNDFLASTPNADYELGLIGIPVIGIMLLFFWIGGSSLIEGVSQNLKIVVLFVVISTAIVASLETQANQSVTKDEVVSPITLLILILIFWVYFYPDYLYSRKKFGLKSRLGIGVILVLFFTGLAIYMQHEISNQQEEIINQLNKFKNDLDSLTN